MRRAVWLLVRAAFFAADLRLAALRFLAARLACCERAPRETVERGSRLSARWRALERRALERRALVFFAEDFFEELLPVEERLALLLLADRLSAEERLLLAFLPALERLLLLEPLRCDCTGWDWPRS